MGETPRLLVFPEFPAISIFWQPRLIEIKQTSLLSKL